MGKAGEILDENNFGEGLEDELFQDDDDCEASKPIQSKGLFGQAVAQDKEVEARRDLDRKVALLITPKGLEKLRAFGYDVVKKAESLPPITTDGRSLERNV